MRKKLPAQTAIFEDKKLFTGDADLHVVEINVMKANHKRATIVLSTRNTIKRRFSDNGSDRMIVDAVARYANVPRNTVLEAMRGWSLEYEVCKRIMNAFRVCAQNYEVFDLNGA